MVNKHFGKVLDEIDGINIIDCETCKFIHKNPLPTKDEWKKFYEKTFYNLDDKSNYLEETEKDIEYRTVLHEDKLFNLEKIINKKSKKSILDIGSSGGLFVDFFLKKGWNAIGVEPSLKAHKYAQEKKRPSINMTIEEFIENSKQKYDVIHLREVIDNFLNPKEILNNLKSKILKKEGILVIDTSNDYNSFQLCACKSLSKSHWWIKGDTLNFFNPKSIEIMLKDLGLKVLHKEATFPLALFLLMGDVYLEDPEKGKEIHKKRVLFEKRLRDSGMRNIKQDLYKKLAEIGLGRNVIIYALNP